MTSRGPFQLNAYCDTVISRLLGFELKTLNYVAKPNLCMFPIPYLRSKILQSALTFPKQIKKEAELGGNAWKCAQTELPFANVSSLLWEYDRCFPLLCNLCSFGKGCPDCTIMARNRIISVLQAEKQRRFTFTSCELYVKMFSPSTYGPDRNIPAFLVMTL